MAVAGHPEGDRPQPCLPVIDRRWLLVGSMNMDLRSSRLNTELALAVDSAALADAAAALLHEHWARGQYRLRLDEVGQRIEWQVQDADGLRPLARRRRFRAREQFRIVSARRACADHDGVCGGAHTLNLGPRRLACDPTAFARRSRNAAVE